MKGLERAINLSRVTQHGGRTSRQNPSPCSASQATSRLTGS